MNPIRTPSTGPAAVTALQYLPIVAVLLGFAACGRDRASPVPTDPLLGSGAPVGEVGPVAAEAPTPSRAWQAGDTCLIAWGGRWWRGHVIAVLGPDLYRIHYDAWADSWDEVVPAARLAPVLAEAPAP